MTNEKSDKIDEKTQDQLESLFKPEENGTEELDDVDTLEDLVEE